MSKLKRLFIQPLFYFRRKTPPEQLLNFADCFFNSFNGFFFANQFADVE